MFPDPECYKERLAALGIHDKAAGADLIHALAAVFAPIIQRDLEGPLSPESGLTQSCSDEHAGHTVINSTKNQSEQTLAARFSACSDDNSEEKEP